MQKTFGHVDTASAPDAYPVILLYRTIAELPQKMKKLVEVVRELEARIRIPRKDMYVPHMFNWKEALTIELPCGKYAAA